MTSLPWSAKAKTGLTFLLLSIALSYIGFTAARAWHKPFWYDEIFTLTVSQQHGLARMWAAETAGFDFNPPLEYLLTKIVRHIPIRQELAVRLPEILAYFLATVCCSLFVAARLPLAYVLPVVCFMLLSESYDYAYEARPYALVLACAAATLLAWQAAASPGISSARRRLALVVLGIGLAAGLLAHCYAVVLYFPVAAGELWRSWRRRRFDLAIWLVLGLSVFPLVLYPALLSASHSVSMAGSIFAPSPRRFLGAYAFLLQRAALPVGIIFAPLIVFAVRASALIPTSMAGLLRSIPQHEIVAVCSLALIPVIAFIVAQVVHSGYIPRYGISGALGFALLLALSTFVLSANRQRWALWIGVGTLAWFTGSFVLAARHWQQEARDREHNRTQVLAAANSGRPIVVSDGRIFVEFGFYFPSDLSQDLFFLFDRDIAISHSGSDIPDTPLSIAQTWLPIRSRIQPYRDFIRSHRRFWLFAPAQTPLEWIQPQLRRDGFVLEHVGGTSMYDAAFNSGATRP